MNYNQCGTDFERGFCLGGEVKHETGESAQIIRENQTGRVNQTTYAEPIKLCKKTFFKKLWVITLVVLLAVSIFSGCGDSNTNEKIIWSDIILCDIVPEPPVDKGEIHENSSEELRVDINDISDKQFNDYMDECREKGFTIDEKSDSISFEAYNNDGYKLILSYYSSSEELCVSVESPMQLSNISWPTSVAGRKIPAPKSTIGKFSYEHDDSFFVYVGDTSKDDYAQYVADCSAGGFSVDYDKGDTYYYADDAEGWHISLRYEGNDIMTVSIDAPDELTTEESEKDANSAEDKKEVDYADISPEFKEVMDSYEKFFDEYVAIMKKYADNPNDVSILSDYTKYMSKYAQMMSDFEKLEDEDMNAAETAYYIEVQGRITKKLLEVA